MQLRSWHLCSPPSAAGQAAAAQLASLGTRRPHRGWGSAGSARARQTRCHGPARGDGSLFSLLTWHPGCAEFLLELQIVFHFLGVCSGSLEHAARFGIIFGHGSQGPGVSGHILCGYFVLSRWAEPWRGAAPCC